MIAYERLVSLKSICSCLCGDLPPTLNLDSCSTLFDKHLVHVSMKTAKTERVFRASSASAIYLSHEDFSN